MDLKWNYKNNQRILNTRETDGVTFLTFDPLDRLGIVKNGFSTRLGGVSQDEFSTMNFAYHKGDDPARVKENFGRMARALGVDRDQMVVSWQTHTTNVRLVTQEDLGKGVIRHRDYRDVDGLITDLPGVTLVTFYADCVPLYLVDPVHRAIGLSHSGWRGTINRMGQKTLEAMKTHFGTKPADVTACIGPSICQDCYEVGEEVAEAFDQAFGRESHGRLMKPGIRPGKFQLDLWEANRQVFQEAGVPDAQIYATNICTRCNGQYLFSHRLMGARRGTLAAFLCLSA